LIDNENNHPYLKEQLALEFEKRTMKEWEAYLEGKDSCVTPVLNFAEACAAEQTHANEMVLTIQDEELGEYKQIGFAMKLSKTPAKHSKRAPRLGEDNEEILGQLNKK